MAATTKLKSKHTTVNTNQKTLELVQAIDETDEMKLKMLGALDKPESGDSLYPAELNAHLCDQLRVCVKFTKLLILTLKVRVMIISTYLNRVNC